MLSLMYVCMYVCMHSFICIYMYMCVYVYVLILEITDSESEQMTLGTQKGIYLKYRYWEKRKAKRIDSHANHGSHHFWIINSITILVHIKVFACPVNYIYQCKLISIVICKWSYMWQNFKASHKNIFEQMAVVFWQKE